MFYGWSSFVLIGIDQGLAYGIAYSAFYLSLRVHHKSQAVVHLGQMLMIMPKSDFV